MSEKQSSFDSIKWTFFGVFVASFVDMIKEIPTSREDKIFVLAVIFTIMYHIWILLNRKEYFVENNFGLHAFLYVLLNFTSLTVMVYSNFNTPGKEWIYYGCLIVFCTVFLYGIVRGILLSEEAKQFCRGLTEDIKPFLKKVITWIQSIFIKITQYIKDFFVHKKGNKKP